MKKYILFPYFHDLAAPKMLNILVQSQNELLVEWSNDNNNGAQIKYNICWKKVGEIWDCHTREYTDPIPSVKLTRLQPATTYNVTVAQYSNDGKSLSKKIHKIAITRSG